MQVGAAAALDGGGRVGPAVVPGGEQVLAQALETAARQFGQQCAAVAEVTVWRGWAHPGGACQLGEGEAAQAALGDEAACRLHQRLAQVAMMVAVAGEGHVSRLYITAAGRDSGNGRGRFTSVTRT